MLKKKKQGKKWDDRGGALITVVVVTAFISILVTIILYAAGMNYLMKTSDKKNKDSFYEAEIVMESIKAELVKEAKPAFQQAYQDTVITFARNSADDRRLLYNQTFANTIKDSFAAHIGTGTLQGYVQSLVAGHLTGSNTLTVGDPASATPATLDVHEDEGYVLLKDVTLEYSKDGYYTRIKTDFMIKVPKIDWSIDTSATGGGAPADLVRNEYDMTDCVIYYNWTKE